MAEKEIQLKQIAGILAEAVKAIFAEKSEIKFSKEPVLERKNIIEYQGKMRADGLEKFEGVATYVSAVNFYLTAQDMGKHKAIGALIIYVAQSYIPNVMKTLKYPPIDDEDEKAMRDSCGTLCNIIAGRFKSGLVASGYRELEMSAFSTYRNSSFNVEFCYKEYDKYEICYYIQDNKRLVTEVTMGALPR